MTTQCHPGLQPHLSRTRPLLRLSTLMLALAAAVAPALSQEATTPTADGVRNSRLDAPLFYQLLLGELNARNGDPGAAYSLILDAARRERDAGLYRRAVEIALQGRSGDSALVAARAWAQAMPESGEADRFVLQILLALNRPGETAPTLRAIVERAPATERVDTINAIPQTFARVTDKAAALQEVRKALASHLSRADTGPAAWTTVGRMELAANLTGDALKSAAQGLQLDPASPYPALLAIELVERGQGEAEVLVRRHLADARTPADSPVPLAYARLLLDLQRSADARTLLDKLTREQPDLAEPWLLLGTVQAQDNPPQAAEASLQRYLSLARASGDERLLRGATQAYLLLAQVAEKRGDFQGATAWLDRIENGNDIMAAQMRRASLLARQGRLDEARALLRAHPERRPEDARVKLVAEAQLLRDAKAWQQAYEVYAQAVARFPEETDLLYDQAMVAEKAGRLDDMERLLRELIAKRPDNHHAYNALGYALADRNIRLAEAKALIEKAVAMAPDDAYIQDSLGWVEFRLGNLPRAREILQAAYRKKPDAEIAAHLGEVLWLSGQKEEALRVWREGLLQGSDNETLQSTLQRFQVKP
ncbi:tetratricopeptide repeat protein [Hydrogenophaga bisanensis]|uniref:Tetratricopeptide repeat protein n=1 Tax=Hydrogenophaga bisanensis TaxID=439611 RepID=A0ABW2R5X2_9BURK